MGTHCGLLAVIGCYYKEGNKAVKLQLNFFPVTMHFRLWRFVRDLYRTACKAVPLGLHKFLE